MVRHAKAYSIERWAQEGGHDKDRPLIPKGVEKFLDVVSELGSILTPPMHIFSSPSKRTFDTAQLLAKHFELPQPKTTDILLKDSSVKQVEAFLLDALQPRVTTVIVGHENHLARILCHLLKGQASSSFHFKKGGCAMLNIHVTQRKLCGQLQWMITPNFLLKRSKEPHNI